MTGGMAKFIIHVHVLRRTDQRKRSRAPIIAQTLFSAFRESHLCLTFENKLKGNERTTHPPEHL